MHEHEEKLVSGSGIPAMLTRKDLEAVFRLSSRTIDRLVSEGKLPGPVYVGRSCRWRKADIVSFLGTHGIEKDS